MDNIHILCISDIHFDKCSFENQGLVIREFFKDLPKVIGEYDRNQLYCIIAGDLVKAGNCSKVYNDFYDLFIKRLTKLIELEHIVCTPGNHDLNRNLLTEKSFREKYEPLLKNKFTEEEFNTRLKIDNKDLILKKFSYFNEFCETKLRIQKYNLLGYSVNFIPEISVYCLNSAILSNGGFDGLPEDEGHLKVETSGLYKWAEENEGRTKILVMHHPLHHLSEYIRNEIENILRKDVDILITGHLHHQNFKTYLGRCDDTMCKFCSSPQFFSDKHDQNGYSLMTFEEAQLVSIQYRKWSTVSEEFTFGNEFSRTCDGIITFERKRFSRDDDTAKILSDNLKRTLSIYNYQPSYVDRKLSNYPPQMKSHVGETIWDYIDIINSKDNIQIVGGSQFGLTTLCHKIIYEAWKNKQEHWLYIDADDLRLSKIQSHIEFFLSAHKIEKGLITTIILDNWNRTYDSNEKILNKLNTLLPSTRIILINNEEDSKFFLGLEENKHEDGYTIMYLRELDRKSIRKLTIEFINRRQFEIDEKDKILERLIIELMDLNVHRTPVNCIQLLMNFQQNYEVKPINRSKILSSLLQFFFLKPDSFFYTESVDEDDCCIIMGALCEKLFRNQAGPCYQRHFSQDEYILVTETIPQRSYSKNVRLKLLHSMEEAQILTKYLNLYEFRFSYWVYYFAAYQMYSSSEFYDYMVKEQHCIFMPEIIEFYTGIDPKGYGIIDEIINNLRHYSNEVSSSLGVKIADPFKFLKSRPNPTFETKTKEQMEEDIMESCLPDEIKDAIADDKYDSAKPYFQAIDTVMDKFKVRNMMSLSRAACRAFRNSNLIDENKRIDLYDVIQSSWYSLFEVLVLLTPALAKYGHGAIGGAGFWLANDFDKDISPSKKIISIVSAIPYNIIFWYKNDVFSEKRLSVFNKMISLSTSNDIIRHFNILLVITTRPKGWENIVHGYIQSLKKNSFYLGDVNNQLNCCFTIDSMTKSDQNITKRLIIECHTKQKDNTNTLNSPPKYLPRYK